jgi:protoporphyrinogen oxidase
MRAWVDTTQKKKTKTNNQRKIKKRKPYATITQGCETMVNDNKEDLRQKKLLFATNRLVTEVH